MKLVYFTHSLRSCWNHGNAHFLRGVLRELTRLGHEVVALEAEQNWSLDNLRRDQTGPLEDSFCGAYPGLTASLYRDAEDYAAHLQDADVVIMHEWNDAALVAAIGQMRAHGARFQLLFHDTHHRAVSDPEAIRTFDLSGYDGVLAFGETLAEVYRRWGWRDRVWVWHEAADLEHFHPPSQPTSREGLVWIGNWGDGERSEELGSYLLRPARAAGLALDIHGVRYPEEALEMLARNGARYRGWIANARAPEVFARHLATVHVPRRFYVRMLPGIPTIRVFEALACGIPLVSAPWDDAEHLFRPGQDYLVAEDETMMTRHMTALREDAALRASLVESGLQSIRARHSCAHRVRELLAICAGLGTRNLKETAA